MVSWGGAVCPLTAVSGEAPLPFVVLSGPLTRNHRTDVGAGACGFHVCLSPTGARALLGERPVADGWAHGLPGAVERWAEAVAAAPTFEDRVALADAFWRAQTSPTPAWADAAVGLIERSGGALPVAALAAALGTSERTLRRRFADEVGVSVKTFAQVERYRQAHRLLLHTPGATWRDVCERFGYADQAHFVRAFHRFTGASPTRWEPGDRALDLGFGLGEGG